MEGFWVETNRGLETLNPGFLREFMTNSAPNLKAEIAKELSMACFHILWDKGPRLVPWTPEDLTHELSATLISLGQLRLARVLTGSNEPLPDFLLEEKETESLEPLTGAITSGFLDVGQLFKGRIARNWAEGPSAGDSATPGEIVLLDAPEPTLGGKAAREWLKKLNHRIAAPGQSFWILCDWTIGPDQSLFSQVSIQEQKEIAIELYRRILKHLQKHGGLNPAIFLPRKTVQTGNGLPEEMPRIPEQVRVGLIPPVQGPGRAISPLFARGELKIDLLARVQSPWIPTFREWVSIVHRIRRYWAKKVPPGERDRLPRTVRWVLKGWTQGPARPQAISILREMARLVPAEDEVCLGYETEIPSDPVEFSRWANDPTLLQYLEECRWRLPAKGPDPKAATPGELTGPITAKGESEQKEMAQAVPQLAWVFQGLIWINNPMGSKKKVAKKTPPNRKPPKE